MLSSRWTGLLHLKEAEVVIRTCYTDGKDIKHIPGSQAIFLTLKETDTLGHVMRHIIAQRAFEKLVDDEQIYSFADVVAVHLYLPRQSKHLAPSLINLHERNGMTPASKIVWTGAYLASIEATRMGFGRDVEPSVLEVVFKQERVQAWIDESGGS